MSNFASRNVKTITLKDGQKVKLRTELSFGEVQKIYNSPEANMSMKMIETVVTSWDLKDDEGGAIPLNKDVIMRLKMSIADEIMAEVGKVFAASSESDKKKPEQEPAA